MTEIGTKTPYWQLALGNQGAVVSGLEDLAQSVSIIVGTPMGSAPGRPDFGCEAFSQLDRPITTAIPRMIQSIFRAIAKWEPRVELRKVSVEPVTPGAVILVLVWAPKGGEDVSQVVWLGAPPVLGSTP